MQRFIESPMSIVPAGQRVRSVRPTPQSPRGGDLFLPRPTRADPLVAARRSRSLAVLALLAPLAATGALASDDTREAAPPEFQRVAGPLHLEDALRLAVAGNWSVRSAEADLAVAKAGLITARTRPNPSASFTTSKIHPDGGDGTELGNGFWERSYDSVALLAQTVEIAKRPARTSAAGAGVDAARWRLADARRTIRASVARAYVGATLAEAQARIARESAGYLRDEARIAGARWAAGDISKSDWDQIEIAAIRLELEAASAEVDARNQRVELGFLIGDPHPAGDLTLADSLEVLAGRAAALAAARHAGERPDLTAARHELRRADEEWKLQRAERIPDPTLFFQLEHEPPDRPNTFGLGVSLPLPLLDRNQGPIEAARAERDAASEAVVIAEARVAADTLTARASFDEALSRWHRYHDELRPRSEEIRKSVSLAFDRGGASLLDQLQAERSDYEVRLETMLAAGDAAMTAAIYESVARFRTPEDDKP